MRTPRRLHAHALLVTAAALALAGGCRQILDLPESVECGSDDACTTAESPCVLGECVDGLCAYSLRPAGTVIDEAGEGDCRSNVCDDAGEVVVAIVPDDAPADTTPGDCVAPSCDAEGNVVTAPADDPPADDAAGDCQAPACADGALTSAPAEDAPPDTTAGDCSAPACDAQGNVVAAPDDADVPTSGDDPGDCVSPSCSGGAVVDAPNDLDAPTDEMPGNCMSPACDNGAVVDVVNEMDTPAMDIDGDCLAPTCDAGGMLVADDTDTPTSGCGSCSNGAVVSWPLVGMACYTGPGGTENVGICVGGTWTCVDNIQTCSGEQTPLQEACGPGASGVNEDCDAQTDEEGPGCNCMLGQTQTCYTGPNGTLNVGICVAGASQCTATMMGNQYGPCMGDVVPQACDSCFVQGDQDCSGTSAACTGDHVFSKNIGGTDFDYSTDVLELPNGEILALGTFVGTVTSANTVTSDGATDVLWLRFDADGNAISAKDWGGAGNDSARQLVLLDDGYLVVGGLGDGSSETFGAAPTLTGVGTDGFVAKFNNSHNVVWKKLLGGTSNDVIAAAVRMPDNGFAVAGQFQGTINLGGSNLVSLGFDDIFVARFDQDGVHLWSQRYGTSMQNNVYDLEVAPNGDLVIVGDLGTSMSFGGPTITVAGGTDAYVVRLDQNGAHLWTRAFQSTGNESARRAAILSDGSVWVAGKFDTAVNVDGVAGADVTPTSTGNDLLYVKYDAAGAYLSGKSVNCTMDVSIRDMEVGFDDTVIIGGSYSGTLFFSPISLPSAGVTDAYLFKIRPDDGNILWWDKYGGTSGDGFNGLDVMSCGDVLAVGEYFFDAVAFGGGALPNQGQVDYVLAKYRQ